MCGELAAFLGAEPADEKKSSKSQKETREEESWGCPKEAPDGYSPPAQTRELKGT